MKEDPHIMRRNLTGGSRHFLGGSCHGAMDNKITAALKGSAPLFWQWNLMKNCA